MQTDIEEIKQILRELAISSKETDREIKELAISSRETDRKFQETDKQLKVLARQIGDLGDKFGYFTEGMALPTLEKLLETRFKLDTITPRFKKKLPNGRNLEYDVLGYCNGTVNNAVVVEIKSKLRYDHIQEMAQEMKDFKINFPEFANKHLYGIMVAVDVPSKDLIDHVQQAGLYFARISDNIFTMTENANAVDFNEK